MAKRNTWPEDGSDSDPRWEGPIGAAILDSIAGQPKDNKMAKKKLSNLVQAMNLFALLDERDKQTLADYVKSQTATPRKKAVKKVEVVPRPKVDTDVA